MCYALFRREGPRYIRDDRGGHRPCALAKLGSGQHHHEFVAAYSGDPAGAPHSLAKSVADLHEHGIAHGMAELIVDRLEPV